MSFLSDFFIRPSDRAAMEALRAHAERRLSHALRRFGPRVRHVTVRLVDENGPRGGLDSRCAIAAELVDGRRLFVDAIAAWPFAAITLAASRLSEATRRAVARRHTKPWRRGSPARLT